MFKPLITIAISTFNRYESLKDYFIPAIDNLNYSNYEVIFIDDHSTDLTSQLLNEYKNKHENVKVLRHSKNQGTPFSRNCAIDNAKGEIIVFADDDVALFPDCLDKIVNLFTKNPELGMGWGCVYQCHGSNDRNKPTFGSGSLFFVKKTIVDYIKFDTNIRYFRTYACEETEFARRVQRCGFKIVKEETVKANHYKAPSKNRVWRGIGGDLNRLYEQLKRRSLLEYYVCLFAGIPLGIKLIFNNKKVIEDVSNHYYSGALLTFHHLLAFIKKGDFLIAIKYLFYVTIDIPIRAKIKQTKDLKIIDLLQNPN